MSRKSCPQYVSLPEYTPLDGEAMVLKMPTEREAL
ncbi:unnamed protein product [Arabidopsis lyrata]|nr:unnamed protein product [Arabidopsis lyrata]